MVLQNVSRMVPQRYLSAAGSSAVEPVVTELDDQGTVLGTHTLPLTSIDHSA